MYTVGEQYPGSEREHYRRVEGECFGIPNGGMVLAIVIGAIIILLGLSIFINSIYGINIDIWPFILVIFGILLIVGAWFRRRRYSRSELQAATSAFGADPLVIPL